MALTVEDGTQVAGAESYISVADADSYHVNRDNTTWFDLSTHVKERCLRKATDYMTGRYGDAWHGFKVSGTQALDWPRDNVPIQGVNLTQYISNSIVPDDVKNACALLALKASSADLLADEERAVIREKVDVIETEYSEHSPQTKRYKEVDAMLAKYLSCHGGLKMVRVA